MNVNIIILNETYLTQGRLHTHWHQYHNYAQRPENGTRGFGGISVLVNPDLHTHIHVQAITSPYVLTFNAGRYTIHALYLPPSLSLSQYRTILHSLTIDEFTLIIGDMNTRMTILGDHDHNERQETFLDWSTINGLTIWNRLLAFGEYTFDGARGRSIIDLFVSQEAAVQDPTLNIQHDLSLNSDHRLCVFSFIPTQPLPTIPTANAPRLHWKLQRLEDPEVKQLYVDKFTETASTLVDTINTYLDNNAPQVPSQQVLDNLNNQLLKAITDALDSSVTRGRMRPKHWKWFWTDELERLAKKREVAFRAWRHARSDDLVDIAERREVFLSARQDFDKELKRTRNRQWRQFCTSMERKSHVDANMVIKRMRRGRNTGPMLTHRDGPHQAAEAMANHLETVFGGNRVQDTPLPLLIVPEEQDPSPFAADVIHRIIRQLAPRKAPGSDSITGAMLKPIAGSLSQVLVQFFSLCWRWSSTPIVWRTAQVVPIFKKGNPDDPANFRPISLTSIFRKILERCMLPKLLAEVPALDMAQGGFRHNRGALDQAFSLHILMRQFWKQYEEWPTVAFLDIKAAYDSVDRQVIWNHMRGHTSPLLLHLCRNMFDNVQLAVILNNHQSRFIHPARGVLQGSIMSPLLYAMFIDSLPRLLRTAPLIRRPLLIRTTPHQGSTEAQDDLFEYHRPLQGRPPRRPDTDITIINALLYADDVAIFGSPADVQRMLNTVESHSQQLGYRWSPAKCEILNPMQETPFTLYDSPLPHTTLFRYLGVPFGSEGISHEQLIHDRINKATGAMTLLRHLGLHRYGMGLWAALRAYRTFVRPSLEYGLAIVALRAPLVHKLQHAQNSCVKLAMNVPSDRRLPTIAQQVLADLPSMRLRMRILQLKFVLRAVELPTTTMLRSISLNWLEKQRTEPVWREIARNNPLWKAWRELLKNNPQTRHPVRKVIKQARDKELVNRREKFSSVNKLRHIRCVDPILYLPVSSRDRHRLIHWRMHWLPSFPPKDCRCGSPAAKRKHYLTCPLVTEYLQDLTLAFANTQQVSSSSDTHIVDTVLNALPRHYKALKRSKWLLTWPALLKYLRRVDYLSHPDSDDYGAEDPPDMALEEILQADFEAAQAQLARA
ncbi:hypothetical protein LRAMOSA06546 [Lichtheimia ramosa]|uniref:Reverse transcriptase domain-containing protein n=1 Tax=Lichtheimia ramosa TaxID=688394 RepID=A0A077X553_9FUNG|nr:hypothetical protein LRAMOSA06546 [Lichtheimia ramosa]